MTAPENRKLDWLPRKDEKSRDFPVTAMPGAYALEDIPRRRAHRGPHHRIDQGAEGACVGFAMAISLMSAPVAAKLAEPEPFAMHVYKEAQKIDYWEGTDYEGTSILAGAQILQRLGYIDSYWWAFGIDQVLRALATDPVIIGINWASSMYDTDEHHIVNLSGHWVGGHAITLTGYGGRKDPRTGKAGLFVRWRNSWGPTYGNRGDGWIRVEDLEWLLSLDGEACVLKGQRWVPKP